MGWFDKKKVKSSETPKLPPLPKMGDLPKFPSDEKESEDDFPTLPEIPKAQFGDGISQDAMKSAVSGERENEDFGDFENNQEFNDMSEISSLPSITENKELTPADYDSYDSVTDAVQPIQMAQPPQSLQPPQAQMQSSYSAPARTREVTAPSDEPIFVRIDKFEESLETFKTIKDEIAKIDKMLTNTKEIKKQEQKELEDWEEQLKSIKNRIEEIDRDIFSKV